MPYFQKHETPDFSFFLVCLRTATVRQSAQFKDLAIGLCDDRHVPFSETEIDFMTGLKLKDLALNDQPEHLTLYDKTKPGYSVIGFTAIQFSKGSPTTGSSKHGDRTVEQLLNHLNDLKKQHPDMTLRDALMDIKWGENSIDNISIKEFAEDIGVGAHTAKQFVEILIKLIPNDPRLRCSDDELTRGSNIHKTLEDLYETLVFEQSFEQSKDLFIKDFDGKLALLNTKINALKSCGETAAAASAHMLLSTLKESGDILFAKPDETPETKASFEKKLKTFKLVCDLAIGEARPILEEHRGWKQFFADLAFLLVSVLTFGTANLVSKKVNGSYGFFNTKTDSIQIVENFERLSKEIKTTDAGDDEDDLAPENSTSSV